MRRVFALGLLYFSYVACSGAAAPIAAEPASPSQSPSPALPAPSAALAERGETVATPAGSASSTPPKAVPKPVDTAKTQGEANGAAPRVANQSSADVDDSACPEGMQLVEGDYCT